MSLSCALILWACVHWGSGERKSAVGALSPCGHEGSCDLCIQRDPLCSWCKQLNFMQAGEPDSTRCDTAERLLQRGCHVENLHGPADRISVALSPSLGQVAEGEGPRQLTPRNVSLRLRLGSEGIFTVNFRRVEGYPVDLYYLMDLSYSMKDDLENIRKLGRNLLVSLRSITQSARIGFGSFVDKTTLPFISLIPRKLRNPCPTRSEHCQPPFSFRNVLPLSADAEAFEMKVGQQEISGNLDPPEGGLDAVMQAAVCEDAIGWRNVTRLLVYTSDAMFHAAGDGRLGGIFLPNDGRCHLDAQGMFNQSEHFDYPSVGQLAQTLSRLNIQPIFAVTQNVLPTYQELSKLIPKSAVGELKADSSNILQLISEAYNNLSSTVKLEHSHLPEGVSVSFQPRCRNPSTDQGGRGECRGVRINEEVSFTVRVSASRCLDPGTRFELRVLGFSETLEVHVETLCACDCGNEGSEGGDEYCSHGNGMLECGQCRCLPGRVGKLCECSRGDLHSEDILQPCRGGNATELCGGRGECVCGKCVCDGNLHGKFCECDDTSCVRHNSQLCAAHGRCRCGQCICDADYTGEACECPLKLTDCLNATDSICGGHGHCLCGKCACDQGYTGKMCEQCLNCPTNCQLLTFCAECLAFGTVVQMEECSAKCPNVTVVMVKKLPEDKLLCLERGSEDELIEYVVVETDSGKRLLVRERDIPKDRRLVIICSVMAGIVLVGLLVLIICRLILEVRDRREYQRFEQERRRMKNNMLLNPLFQSAVTTTINPQYIPD